MMRTLFAREVVSGGLAALPSLNTRVTVTPHAGPTAHTHTVQGRPGSSNAAGPVEAPSRVEDLRLEMTGRRPGPVELVIAQPSFPGNLQGETAGAEYLVRWVTERGVFEVVGRYLGRERIGPAVIGWRLRVAGPVSRIQRRAHARVELAVPIEVAVLDDGPGGRGTGVTVLRGLTVNLSEGGVLAALEPPCPPATGASVVVRFGMADERFVLTGRIVRLQPTSGRPGVLGVAVQFDSPDTHGDRLRPLLFAHQLNARRIGVS